MTLVTLPQYAHVTPLPEKKLNILLQKTKGRLFFKHSSAFIGRLLCDLKFVWDSTIKTANCDGVTLRCNPAFFTWLNPEERVTLIAHEVWHPGFGHVLRARVGTRIFELWNQAADHVINVMLSDASFVFGPQLMSLGPCMDFRFRGMITEHVYEILLKEAKADEAANGTPVPSMMDAAGYDLADVVISTAEKGTVERIIQSAQQAAKAANQAGTIPGETTCLLDEFFNPILPWEVLLQQWFTALSNDDYSWSRPDRRHEEFYLPSMLSEDGLEHLMYFWDISGSVTDTDIGQCNSEVKHIHDALQPDLLSLVTFDHELQDFYEFERDLPYEKVKVTGRGGTCLKPVLAHIQKHRPTGAIIFSDLECAPMPEDPKVPVLWVVLNNPSATVPFGKMVHISTE